MIALAVITILGFLTVLVPCLIVARFMEWRAQDADRRIARIRQRRLWQASWDIAVHYYGQTVDDAVRKLELRR